MPTVNFQIINFLPGPVAQVAAEAALTYSSRLDLARAWHDCSPELFRQVYLDEEISDPEKVLLVSRPQNEENQKFIIEHCDQFLLDLALPWNLALAPSAQEVFLDALKSGKIRQAFFVEYALKIRWNESSIKRLFASPLLAGALGDPALIISLAAKHLAVFSPEQRQAIYPQALGNRHLWAALARDDSLFVEILPYLKRLPETTSAYKSAQKYAEISPFCAFPELQSIFPTLLAQAKARQNPFLDSPNPSPQKSFTWALNNSLPGLMARILRQNPDNPQLKKWKQKASSNPNFLMILDEFITLSDLKDLPANRVMPSETTASLIKEAQNLSTQYGTDLAKWKKYWASLQNVANLSSLTL